MIKLLTLLSCLTISFGILSNNQEKLVNASSNLFQLNFHDSSLNIDESNNPIEYYSTSNYSNFYAILKSNSYYDFYTEEFLNKTNSNLLTYRTGVDSWYHPSLEDYKENCLIFSSANCNFYLNDNLTFYIDSLYQYENYLNYLVNTILNVDEISIPFLSFNNEVYLSLNYSNSVWSLEKQKELDIIEVKNSDLGYLYKITLNEDIDYINQFGLLNLKSNFMSYTCSSIGNFYIDESIRYNFKNMPFMIDNVNYKDNILQLQIPYSSLMDLYYPDCENAGLKLTEHDDWLPTIYIGSSENNGKKGFSSISFNVKSSTGTYLEDGSFVPSTSNIVDENVSPTQLFNLGSGDEGTYINIYYDLNLSDKIGSGSVSLDSLTFSFKRITSPESIDYTNTMIEFTDLSDFNFCKMNFSAEPVVRKAYYNFKEYDYHMYTSDTNNGLFNDLFNEFINKYIFGNNGYLGHYQFYGFDLTFDEEKLFKIPNVQKIKMSYSVSGLFDNKFINREFILGDSNFKTEESNKSNALVTIYEYAKENDLGTILLRSNDYDSYYLTPSGNMSDKTISDVVLYNNHIYDYMFINYRSKDDISNNVNQLIVNKPLEITYLDEANSVQLAVTNDLGLHIGEDGQVYDLYGNLRLDYHVVENTYTDVDGNQSSSSTIVDSNGNDYVFDETIDTGTEDPDDPNYDDNEQNNNSIFDTIKDFINQNFGNLTNNLIDFAKKVIGGILIAFILIKLIQFLIRELRLKRKVKKMIHKNNKKRGK